MAKVGASRRQQAPEELLVAEVSWDRGGDGGHRGASHPGELLAACWGSIPLQGWGAAR